MIAKSRIFSIAKTAAVVLVSFGLLYVLRTYGMNAPTANPPTGGGAIGVASGAPVSSVYVLNSGNVGIATTTPAEKLTVNGNILATSFLYLSDARLKKDIRPLESVLAKVMQVVPSRFTWQSNDQADIGVIAQQIEPLFPEVVHTNGVTGLKTVDYAKLVPMMLKALQEQQGMIAQQQEEISRIKTLLGI